MPERFGALKRGQDSRLGSPALAHSLLNLCCCHHYIVRWMRTAAPMVGTLRPLILLRAEGNARG